MEKSVNMFGVSVLLLTILVNSYSSAVTILEKMRDDADLSEFYAKLESTKLAKFNLEFKQATVFAPTNEAFQKLDTNFVFEQDALVLYHMNNVAKTLNALGDSHLVSEAEGNPPLWITHVSGAEKGELYVNNARILIEDSNFKAKNKEGREQVLHKINEVLIHVRPTSLSSNLFNPDALQFLENFEEMNVRDIRLRTFRQRVRVTYKQDIFKNEGKNTFFIPIDEGFSNPERAEDVDAKIIDGHVIAERVLFTAPTTKDEFYKTLAVVDGGLRVVVSFTEETQGKSTTIYVKSHTLVGDATHRKGVVLAEIERANIPVRNGVIHLIKRPLMVVDNNVLKLLEEKEKGPLGKFLQEVKNLGEVESEKFLKILETQHNLTLFVPTNSAWDDRNLQNILRNREQFKEILNMHLVPEIKLLTDDIRRSGHEIHKAETRNRRYPIRLDVVRRDGRAVLTVNVGGVNATVLQADLAATNGVIHIIDRVLGVPYNTILDKLREDPFLSQSYRLGNKRSFHRIHELDSPAKKFTYFVPNNEAWKAAHIAFPTAVKKLFMDEYSYYANVILERHLIISDTTFTMERIRQLSYENQTNYGYGSSYKREVTLPSVKDNLRLYVEATNDYIVNDTSSQNSTSYTIIWNGRRIQVAQANVECTNGIIHVIDFPFIMQGDIRVNSATSLIVTPHVIMLMFVKLLLH